jgi:hypothetical protein
MVKMNDSQKMAYFTSRRQQGDLTTIAENTGYSVSHISNVLAGRKTANKVMTNEMYKISQGRKRNKK